MTLVNTAIGAPTVQPLLVFDLYEYEKGDTMGLGCCC